MLCEITAPTHGVMLDLRYATDDNFTGAPVYGRPACYLHPEAEQGLRRAVTLARGLGYRLKLFDAFRPTEAQWHFWSVNPDPEFLSDPRRGSPHSRGAAIDLTLVDEDGASLDMGTEFDAFTRHSHHGAEGVSVAATRNRLILLGIMTTAGWDFYRNEWWHYQLFNARRLPLLSDRVLKYPMMRPGL